MEMFFKTFGSLSIGARFVVLSKDSDKFTTDAKVLTKISAREAATTWWWRRKLQLHQSVDVLEVAQ